jgi:hypothetical protein
MPLQRVASTTEQCACGFAMRSILRLVYNNMLTRGDVTPKLQQQQRCISWCRYVDKGVTHIKLFQKCNCSLYAIQVGLRKD